MNEKTVERYILVNYRSKPSNVGHSMKKAFLCKAVVGCFSVIVLWWIALSYNPFDRHSNFDIRLFAALILMTLLTITLSIKIYKSNFMKLHCMDEAELCNKNPAKKISPRKSTGGVIISYLGLMRLRDLNAELFVMAMFLGVIFGVVWVIAFRVCNNFYRIHLINKYCPYLITLADRRYPLEEDSEE